MNGRQFAYRFFIALNLLIGIKKVRPKSLTELSYQDSNLDKLIQSQMCYRYTIGQCFHLEKSGAKVLFFFDMNKYFSNKVINA